MIRERVYFSHAHNSLFLLILPNNIFVHSTKLLHDLLRALIRNGKTARFALCKDEKKGLCKLYVKYLN